MSDPEPPLRRSLRRPGSEDPDPASPDPASSAPPSPGPASSAPLPEPPAPSVPSPGAPSPGPVSPPVAGAHPGPATPLAPRVEPPSPDVVAAGETWVLPGAHRGGFSRELTAPVDVTRLQHDEVEVGEGWAESPPMPRGTRAGWTLGLAIAGLVVSIFVGWGFPLGITALILGILALRSPIEKRPVAIWGIVLAAVSLLYSAGWLMWGIPRLSALIG